MLYINCDGDLVEININDFITDSDYYKAIMKGISPSTP